MNTISRTALLAAVAAVAVLAPGAAASAVRPSFQAHLDALAAPSGYVPGQLIVGFRSRAGRAAATRAHARVGARVTMRLPAFHMQVVKLPRGLSVRAAVQRYERDPAVKYAEPNYLRYPTLTLPDSTDLWALHNTEQDHPVTETDFPKSPASPQAGSDNADIDAAEALDDQRGSGTIVAVIDSGVDVDHPDLSGQLWTNPDDPAGNGDDDGNGKVDDTNGWDFQEGDATLIAPANFDGWDHGTHVAGTIAAALDGSGVSGVCPECQIMVLKIARDSDGAMPITAEIAAINYARSHDARVANLSLSGPLFSIAEREAIRKSGMLVVAAASNESLDNDMALASDVDGDGRIDIASPSYPAAYSLANVLTVAASNHNDEYGYQTECHLEGGMTRAACAFTNWGHDSVDLAAPGVDITSTVPGGGVETYDGTSMAAPHVTGVAGLVWGQNPLYSVAAVKNKLMRSVNKPASLGTMFIRPAPGLTAARAKPGSFTRTSGRVNADRALDASTTNATTLTDGNVDGAKLMSTSRVRGSVSWPADVNDVRKRKLRKGVTYRFKLVVPRGKDYDLVVWTPAAKEIWQFSKLRAASARAGSVDEVVRFRARGTGVYYIQVSAWLYQSGNYVLKFARL